MSSIRKAGEYFTGAPEVNLSVLPPAVLRSTFNILETWFQVHCLLISPAAAVGIEALSRGARQCIFIEKVPSISMY